ncbi:MAG: enoyl-CoA hydratase [Sneathiella sp.]
MSEIIKEEMIDEDAVVLTVADKIATIRLNNPAARNALSTSVMASIQEMLDDLHGSNEAHVVVLEAVGPVFCSGHNLKEIIGIDREATMLELFEQCSKMMQSIVNLPKPVIAKVNGMATAAGTQLIASCDLAFASSTSTFATPGVNLGLFCSTPMVALSRNVSPKHAMEMLLGGEFADAEQAARIGLINYAVAEEDLDKTVLDYANRIASKSPLTVRTGKAAFYNQLTMSLDEAYAYTSRVMSENMQTLDAQEGISAFLEKRNPKWRGE